MTNEFGGPFWLLNLCHPKLLILKRSWFGLTFNKRYSRSKIRSTREAVEASFPRLAVKRASWFASFAGGGSAEAIAEVYSAQGRFLISTITDSSAKAQL